MFAEFTTAQMIFFSGIIGIFAYSAIKLRSVMSMLSWGIMVIALVGVMQYNMGLEWFWISTIITVIVLIISSASYSFQ